MTILINSFCHKLVATDRQTVSGPVFKEREGQFYEWFMLPSPLPVWAFCSYCLPTAGSEVMQFCGKTHQLTDFFKKKFISSQISKMI